MKLFYGVIQARKKDNIFLIMTIQKNHFLKKIC